MYHVKSPPYSEDIFDENASDMCISSKGWKRVMTNRVKDGYIDGIDNATMSTLQVGFNCGYREGAGQTMAVGRLKGILNATKCWYQLQHPDRHLPAAVTELLQRVEKHKTFITEAMIRACDSPLASANDVVENMQILEVDEGSASCIGEGLCEKEADCCTDKINMVLDAPDNPQVTYLSPRDWSSHSEEVWAELLQSSVDLVVELGMPQELIQHLEHLKCLGVSKN